MMAPRVDTNVVLRLLLQDDEAQFAAAEKLIQEGIFIASTVLVETVWVLSSRYRLEKGAIADALGALLNDQNVEVDDRQGMAWALHQYRDGADFADAVHVLGSNSTARFVTFDRDLVRRLQSTAPTPVDLNGELPEAG